MAPEITTSHDHAAFLKKEGHRHVTLRMMDRISDTLIGIMKVSKDDTHGHIATLEQRVAALEALVLGGKPLLRDGDVWRENEHFRPARSARIPALHGSALKGTSQGRRSTMPAGGCG
jgi:hypothetical protein